MKKIIMVVFFSLVLCSFITEKSNAQQPYYTKKDSVVSNAGGTDSLATFIPGKLAYWIGITVTNSTTQDTLKVRGTWYGNTAAYKTLSLRNTKNGTVDSVFVIPATAGLPQTFEIVDPNVDRIEVYGLHAGNVVAGRVCYVYFRYRK